MKLLNSLVAIALALGFAGGASALGVTYELEGANNHHLVLTTEDFVSADTTFLASGVTSCFSPYGECTQVRFYEDAFSAGLTLTNGLQGIGIYTDSVISYFYFYRPALTTLGTHDDLFSTDTLTVSAIPEASTLAMSSLGLLFVGFATWRARGSSRGKA